MSALTLVTGGAGFLGTHVVQQLADAGARVRVLDVAPAPDGSPAEWVCGSVADEGRVATAVQGVSRVIHLAAIPHLWVSPSSRFDDVNWHGTQVTLAAARSEGVEAFVHVSSLTTRIGGTSGGEVRLVREADRLPLEAMLGPYPRSKWRAEDAARQARAAGMPVRIAIPTMPLGPGDRGLTPPARMVLDFLCGRTPAYLESWMNIADVRDMAAGLIACLDIETGADGVFLGGDNILLGDLLARLQQRSGVTMPSATVPGWLAEAAALVDEGILSRLTNRPPKAPLTGVRLARRPVSFDLAKANELLPERRHTLNQTLSDLFAWFEAEGLWRRE
jgi:dihydroflavonol-4-reductase